MRQKSGPEKQPAEDAIRDIRRATRRHFSAEEKIRIVLEGLRGEESIAELCRREGIASSMYYPLGDPPVGEGAVEAPVAPRVSSRGQNTRVVCSRRPPFRRQRAIGRLQPRRRAAWRCPHASCLRQRA
jgi:Transposase